MRLIGNGAEICVHEGNEVVDECLLKRAEVEISRPARRSVRCASSRSSIRSPLRTSERVATKFHRNYERLRFSVGEQVVHDETSVALSAPAGFVLARTVLQIEHRVTPVRVLVVIRCSICNTVRARTK